MNPNRLSPEHQEVARKASEKIKQALVDDGWSINERTEDDI